MLIEIHMLQNHAPANLNRDDSNSPKDCIFGGYRRARISSQCLKRTIRSSDYFKEAVGELGLRTRKLPQLIEEELLALGMDAKVAKKIGRLMADTGKKKGSEEGNDLTKQIMFYSRAEIKEIAKLLKEKIGNETDDKKLKEKFDKATVERKKLKLTKVTPDIALFGRMVTDNTFQDIDSAIQVAHAITTNKMEHEFDFFTAVDDLDADKKGLESQGSAMMGDVEFTSGTFYKYFSIDVDGYKSNMMLNDENKDKENIVNDIVKNSIVGFLKGAIFTNPSGKQNTFAAHQLPSAILIEIKDKKVPVSYANAFVQPVSPYGNKDLIQVSVEKLVDHVDELKKRFSLESNKTFWFTDRADLPAPANAIVFDNIDKMAEELEKSISGVF